MPQVKCKFKKLGKFISDIESLKNSPEMFAASRKYEIAIVQKLITELDIICA